LPHPAALALVVTARRLRYRRHIRHGLNGPVWPVPDASSTTRALPCRGRPLASPAPAPTGLDRRRARLRTACRAHVTRINRGFPAVQRRHPGRVTQPASA